MSDKAIVGAGCFWGVEARFRQPDVSDRHFRPVVTAIETAVTFRRAEDHHQQYLARQGACCLIHGS